MKILEHADTAGYLSSGQLSYDTFTQRNILYTPLNPSQKTHGKDERAVYFRIKRLSLSHSVKYSTQVTVGKITFLDRDDTCPTQIVIQSTH